MTYKDTAYLSFKNYPKLFPNTLYLDNHLFACFGTGYSWVGGQLVADNYYCPSGDADEAENIAEANYESTFTDKYDEIPTEYCPVVDHQMLAIAKRLKELGLDANDIEEKSSWHVYPFCEEYSPLANIPNDIQSDWLEAVERFVDYLIEHPEYVSNPKFDNTNDFTKSEAAKRPEILKKAKERINELKSK